MASPGLARSARIGIDWKKVEGLVVNNKLALRKLLGSTDYSAVFLSHSPNAQAKDIAIKLISAGAHSGSQTLLHQRASKLNHPNLQRLLPGGPCRLAGMNFVFVVMEYAEEDLGTILPNRALSLEETRVMLALTLDALSDIHSNGLAHSHIKPSNVLSIGNQIKLSSDAVLPLGEQRPVYRPLDAYDAPEAGTAGMATSSDIWSLGVTLVEVLTQRVLVLSPDGQAVPVVPDNIPQPFFEIARQCLHRDPLERWTLEQIADCLSLAPVQVAAPLVTADAEETEPATVPSTEVTVEAEVTAVAVSVPETEPPARDEEDSVPVSLAVSQSAAAKPIGSPSEAWQDIHYAWVVLCKNYFFHMRQNLFFRHRIPLAYTDPFSPVPHLKGSFKAACDDCHRTYVYRPSEVRRYEGELPRFKTHPLF